MTDYKDYELFRLAEMGLLKRVEILSEKDREYNPELMGSDYYRLDAGFIWSDTYEGHSYWSDISSDIEHEYILQTNN